MIEGSQLPVIDRPIDNTVLVEYMSCPRAYDFAYRRHRRSSDTAAPLMFGRWWHEVMETHYKTGGNQRAVDDVIEQWMAEGGAAEGEYRTPGRLKVVYEDYRKRWDIEADCTATVGFPDNPLVEISTSVVGGKLIHPYAGKLDRVIKDGNYWIEDHKTTSRLDRYYFDSYKTDNQMKGYTYMGRLLFPSLRIQGVRINLAHVTKTKHEFHRQYIPFTDDILEEWAENTNNWLRRMARDYENDDFPGHFGLNGCNRKFGMCQFHRVCGASRHIREQVLEQEFDIVPWNPLEADEDGEE